MGIVGKRLFIAVDIDDRTREQIGRIASGARTVMATWRNVSWVRPDRMHLTLHFFASADAPLEQRVCGALADPIPEAAFDLSFGGLGFFPERGSPRVLWLGVRHGADALGRIHAHLAGRIGTRALSDRPHGSFTPHLTLARVRERTPRAKLAQLADVPAFAGPSRIDRVTLYESRLSPAGSSYHPLAEAPLHT